MIAEQYDVLGLTANQLIEWCKERKDELGISNQELACQAGVPQGTVDRLMAGRYSEFRYSSIQPIVAFLIGHNEAIPTPETKADVSYYKTIEGYRLVVANKDREIENLKVMNERTKAELAYVKLENEQKRELLKHYHEHVKWLEEMIDIAKSAMVMK